MTGVNDTSPPTDADSRPAPQPDPQPLRLCTRDLFRDGNTVRIDHEGQTYWLRLTRANKLILTK